MKRIGILGGMGPAATILLMQRIMAATQAADDADHIPLIVDQNTQVPSRIARLIDGRGADPAPVLVAMAQRLEQAGAQALAMPCNTAHHYAADIARAVRIPFIDMVALSVARARSLTGTRVGVIGSPALRQIGLYDRALAQAGLTPAYPPDQDALLAAIRQIKATGPTAATRATLIRASSDLLELGARVQIIACTEFSLIADATAPGAQAFDTLDVLTAAICTFATGPDRT